MTIKSILKRVLIRCGLVQVIKEREVVRPYEINLKESNRFKGQVAVVTGGSGVIGRAICYRLASEGASVIVCGSNEQRTQATTNEIVNAGMKAESCLFNLLDTNSIESAFKWIIEKYGRIDTLVTCAGGAQERKCILSKIKKYQ